MVDVDRQWFKSSCGLDATQTRRNDGFCAYTILPETPDVFVVPDSHEDARFCDGALVRGPPYIRFYAGAALFIAGVKIGSLCLVDSKPHHDFDMIQRMNLLDLSTAVSALIKERRNLNLKAKNDCSSFMVNLMHDIRTPLMSLNIGSSIIEEDKAIILSKLQSPDTLNVAHRFQHSLEDVISAVTEIKHHVEDSLNLSSKLLDQKYKRDSSIASSIRSPMIQCDVFSTIQISVEKAKGLTKLFALRSSIDSSLSLKGKLYLSYPDVISQTIITLLTETTSTNLYNKVNEFHAKFDILQNDSDSMGGDGLSSSIHDTTQNNYDIDGVTEGMITFLINIEFINPSNDDNIINIDNINMTSLKHSESIHADESIRSKRRQSIPITLQSLSSVLSNFGGRLEYYTSTYPYTDKCLKCYIPCVTMPIPSGRKSIGYCGKKKGKNLREGFDSLSGLMSEDSEDTYEPPYTYPSIRYELYLFIHNFLFFFNMVMMMIRCVVCFSTVESC